ncbi:DUF2789 domain-containing protein [Chitinolyticbacter meiyuanensis]|uniref:DUF2789 domain-containing protein n=1 Tax=Chitinolyticbacter meiyuanensis TaxID=682798 RepID=UPI0011E5BF10|nr:DUF2789 domain-containing protein [Chitinolyticbacter meiyuanensis]
MDTTPHTLTTLFAQLGLPMDKDGIEAFLASHSLPAGQSLPDASFWNSSQASFLREALAADAEWAEDVDELAARLTH